MRIFNILPQKVSRTIQLQALRRGSKPLIKSARDEAPKRKKTLSKSIGTVNDKNKKSAAIWVAVRTGRRAKYDGWHGWFVHEGTKGFGKRTRSKGQTTGYGRSGSGIEANPFFQRAWDNSNRTVFGEIKRELAEKVTNYLRSAAPKYYG